MIDTNLTGVFYCCQAAIPHLRRRGGGWIINISSLSGTNPFTGGAAYCASKAGLNAFSEALMQELRYDDIRVSYVMPGSVATDFSERAVTLKPTTGNFAPMMSLEVVVDLLAHDGAKPSEPRRDSSLQASQVVLRMPDAVAHYRIIDRRRAGGLVEVSRATDTRLARTVAIKVLPAELLDDRARLERMLQAARQAAMRVVGSHPRRAHGTGRRRLRAAANPKSSRRGRMVAVMGADGGRPRRLLVVAHRSFGQLCTAASPRWQTSRLGRPGREHRIRENKDHCAAGDTRGSAFSQERLRARLRVYATCLRTD